MIKRYCNCCKEEIRDDEDYFVINIKQVVKDSVATHHAMAPQEKDICPSCFHTIKKVLEGSDKNAV